MVGTYINRHSDKITFTLLSEKAVEMTGFYPAAISCHFDKDPKKLKAVDPSGGPFISIGDDLSEFFKDHTRRTVKTITLNNSKIIFEV